MQGTTNSEYRKPRMLRVLLRKCENALDNVSVGGTEKSGDSIKNTGYVESIVRFRTTSWSMNNDFELILPYGIR